MCSFRSQTSFRVQRSAGKPLWLIIVERTVLILKINMSAMKRRSWSCWTFLILLLSLLLHFNPLLAFSLKNCTVDYSNNMTSVECTNRGLSAIPDDIPEDAVSLVLSNNHILKINRSDLSSLSKLRYLQMGTNSISHVDDGAFSGLDLVQLSLGSNNLTNLTDNMFQGLWKLINLSLEKNWISNISPLAFQSLVSLQTLELMYNPICQITAIAPILQLPNLVEIILGFNSFTSFDSDDLPLNKSNVRYLFLPGNLLNRFSIKRDIFPHLQWLHLCINTSFEWDVEDTTFLRNLTVLRLDMFDISREMFRKVLKSVESVQELLMSSMENDMVDIACQISALKTLDLCNNDYVSINDTLLQSCSELIELDLSSNYIEEMFEFSLRSMKQLKHLDLRENFLLKVPPAIRGLHTLKTLNLSLNFIGELGCSDFFNLTGLMKLDLSQNRISTLDGCVFQDLKDLKVLNIRENKVHRLIDFFKVNLQKLEFLDLHGNDFRQLKTNDFRHLSSLTFLDLESDQVYAVHKGAFEGLDNLQTLSVSPFIYDLMIFRGVNLKRLEHLKLHLTSLNIINSSNPKNEPPFSKFPSLKSLVIQNYNGYHHRIPPDLLKGLKSLEYFTAVRFFIAPPHPDTFIGTPDLKSLQIIQSSLQEINPKLFQPIPKLQALDLSQNKLRSLDFLTKVDLSTLSWLALRDNELTVINETLFLSLPSLMYLDLMGNPFICDCSNVGFIQWVKNNNQTQVVYAYQYDCSFPPAKQGTKLFEIDIESCRTDVNMLCFISTTCLVMLTLFTSFIYHFLRWQLAYTFYIFLAFLYDSRKRKKGAPHHYDAFISYNVHDEAWVYGEMLPVLEGEQGWRLCLHHRDFQPGKPIIENITDAIYSSRKTICVISRRYLQSEWCSREIQMASFRLFDEQQDVLILLFVEEIPAWQLSPYYRMRRLLKRQSYLSWTQAGQHTEVFWQNVRRALQTGDADNIDLLTGPEC